MWSEAIALDMLSRYQGKLMNPEIGRLYRKTILSRGSEMRGDQLVKAFLGRAPNNKAFFDEITGQRLH
jgi:thimet oligopeptidase